MEKNEISLHEVKIYLAIRARPDVWLTNTQISDLADTKSRTTRAHTLKLVKLGLIDQAEVFPAHRFRWADKADKRNGSYVMRLDGAASVFGLKIGDR